MPPVWRLSDIAPAFQSPDPDAPPPSLLRVTVYCVLSCHLNRAIIGQIEKTDKYMDIKRQLTSVYNKCQV